MLQRICIILKQNQTHKAKQNQPTTPSQKKTKKNKTKQPLSLLTCIFKMSAYFGLLSLFLDYGCK